MMWRITTCSILVIILEKNGVMFLKRTEAGVMRYQNQESSIFFIARYF